MRENRSDHVDCKCPLLCSIIIVYIKIVRQTVFEREKVCVQAAKKMFSNDVEHRKSLKILKFRKHNLDDLKTTRNYKDLKNLTFCNISSGFEIY